MRNSGCLLLLALIVALVAMTYVLAQRDPAIDAAQARRLNADAARAEVSTQIARDTAGAQVTARRLLYLGAGVAGVVLAVGLSLSSVVWLTRRAATIYPNRAGQFPLVRVSGQGWSGVIDPNRAPTNVTVIRAGDGPGVQIAQPLTVSEQGHVALAAQASGVAAIVAATRKGDAGRVALDATRSIQQATLGAPIPSVEPLEDGHVERLLALNAPAGDDDVVEGEFWT